MLQSEGFRVDELFNMLMKIQTWRERAEPFCELLNDVPRSLEFFQD